MFNDDVAINIYQVGCGGGGGWLVQPLNLFLNNFKKQRPNNRINYILMDDDNVEEKNLLRQNFLKEDIGKNKAIALAERFGIEDILPFRFNKKHMDMFLNKKEDSIDIILGMTDSIDFRVDLINHPNFKNVTAFIDVGNTDKNGQVYVVSLKENIPSFNLEEPVFSDKYYEAHIFDEYKKTFEELKLNKDNEEVKVKTEEFSCAELGDQTILMNWKTALNAYSILTEYLLTGKINCWKVSFSRYTKLLSMDSARAFIDQTI